MTRVYVDTSVFGGAFDEKFDVASRTFFDEAHSERFQIVVSDVVAEEMYEAPRQVQELYENLQPIMEVADITEEALRLVRSYVSAGVVTEKWRTDALHVAIASVCRCPAIVSWNFRHIVHFEKITLYNRVNVVQGYDAIAIHTPQEMVHYEAENENL